MGSHAYLLPATASYDFYCPAATDRQTIPLFTPMYFTYSMGREINLNNTNPFTTISGAYGAAVYILCLFDLFVYAILYNSTCWVVLGRALFRPL